MIINEKNFIAQIKRKNEKALEYVIDHYGWIIKTVVNKQLKNLRDYQGECMNDVLLGIWNNIDYFNPKKSSFKNWIAGIARYKSIDYARKYMKQLDKESWEEIEQVDPVSMEAKVLEQQISEEVEQILSCLSTEDQEIFLRLYVKEETVEQVSQSMGISKENLYNRTSRGKSKIRSFAPHLERRKKYE